MKNSEKLTNIIESIVFVSGQKISVTDIAEKLEITEKDVLDCVKKLQGKYSGDCGIQLLLFNKKLQFCSNPEYSDDVSSVLNPIKEKELSKSLLETAAIIAYKQPVTRIDLEEIRGNSEYAIQKLLELNMIEPVGRKDAVGRPVLFGTTDEFLKRFQISSIDDLPDYEELINKISLLRGDNDTESYLYKKDVFVDEGVNKESEVAVSEDEKSGNILSSNENSENPKTEKPAEKEDFDLPDISEEEIPDFLAGEDVDIISDK